MPHIRIFPHSQDEFPSMDALQTWLMTALRAGGGRYLLRSADRIADLPQGSVVLFRYGDELAGEAIVREYAREPHTSKTLSGEERQYEARIAFASSSIRVFAPPIRIDELQRIVGEDSRIMMPMPYYAIRDWTVYPKLLASHIARTGTFL